MRLIRGIAILFLFFFPLWSCLPQSPTGTISGQVLDPDGRAIAGAEILVVNDLTGLQYAGKSNEDGIYLVTNLPPGPYRVQVSKIGFKAIIKPDIVLNVEDALSINFKLPIGAASITVTVESGVSSVNTIDGSVSTVVDRKFVENLPLNGRSFQDLILLTPGVVTNSPQTQASVGFNGEFSVNGQRTESNYYVVDGVSANTGMAAGVVETPGSSGSLPAATSLGTTHALVSVDALEEFRVQSSTYSAEYGRNPGGQFSFATRSGTNQWHGTAFDYLRNNVFDANDWFNGYYGVPQPALRQNDFGGTLGGPVEIPRLYKGKGRTFFFFSYEGLRLRQPQEAGASYVPTLALRASAPSALQPILNSFPLPNCPTSTAARNCATDLGNGLGDFVASWSNPSSIDAYSLRLDHSFGEKLRVFFRVSDTPSRVDSRLNSVSFGVPSTGYATSFKTRTYTAGVTSALSSRISNELRLNFTSNGSELSLVPTDFGGAAPVDLVQLQGLDAQTFPNALMTICLAPSGYYSCVSQEHRQGRQEQWNLVDSVSVALGRHQLKFGADYRRLASSQHLDNPSETYRFGSVASVQANSVDFGFAQSYAAAFPVYTNISFYGQDQWRLRPRLSLSMGLRWEVNPAPGVTGGPRPYTVSGNIDDVSSLILAPQGTPLWQTSWHNLAPRVGLAYVVRNRNNYETVLKGGFGVFYDTGQQEGSQGFLGVGFHTIDFFGNSFGSPASFPVPPSQAVPAVVNPPVAPYGTVYAFPAHLDLPFTLQWNASVSQGLGKTQSLTVSYVGANGRRLLEQRAISPGSSNPAFSSIEFFENGLTSDYNALQIQFQRRLSRGFQALASYTWAHSIDYGSYNEALPYQRASSDFDVRHSFASALSYDVPTLREPHAVAVLLNQWGVDSRFTARSAFPVPLNGDFVVDPATGQTSNGGLDLLPGQPLYLFGSQYPAGRSINPAAFATPASGQIGDAPRNLVRGFDAWQMDITIRRDFPIHERLKLQFRTEIFNVFNHPNFGLVNSTYCAPGPGCTFGQATSSLAGSLGTLSPLYQMGGPRSLQLALKLAF